MTIVADLIAKLRLQPDQHSFTAADRMIGGIRKALVAVAGLAATNWARNQIQQVTDTADKFAKLAQSTGVNVEALQELAHAGNLSGVSVDEMAQSMGVLQRNLAGASEGGREQARAFLALGVSIRDASGDLRSADAVMGDVADRFASMPDGTEKSALAMKAFGRSGAQLIPLLNEGRDGLAAMRQEARDLGIVMDSETRKSFVDLNDDQTRLKASLMAVKIQIVRALAPAITRITKSVGAWVKANRELISKRVTQAVTALGKAFTAVGKVIGFVFDLVERHSGAAKIAIYSLIGAIAAFKTASIAAGIASGAAWMIGLWPLGLLAIGLLIAALAVEDLITAFEGGDSVLKQLYLSVVNWVVGGITRAFWATVNSVKAFFQGFFDWFADKFAWLENKIRGALDWVSDKVGWVGRKTGLMTAGTPEENAALEAWKASGFKGNMLDFMDAESDQGKVMTSSPWNRNMFNPTASAPAIGSKYGTVSVDAPMNATVNISVPPGASAEEQERITRRALDDHWDAKVRETEVIYSDWVTVGR
jgi:hypothetical protein